MDIDKKANANIQKGETIPILNPALNHILKHNLNLSYGQILKEIL